MHKMLVIARREYAAAVKTKAFIIGLLLMPLMIGVSIVVQKLVEGVHDVRDKHFVVVNRTANDKLREKLELAVSAYNATVNDPKTGKQARARFKVEFEDPGEVKDQRFALSERVRQGELFGFLDIGPDVLTAEPLSFNRRKDNALELADGIIVRYHSNKPTFADFSQLAEKTISLVALTERAKKLGVSPEVIGKAALPVPLVPKGLLQRDASGEIRDASENSQLAGFFVPFILLMLMFVVIMSGATPLMQGIVEEKMQRIAEVLLGSVSPFQLMMGKLLGMTAVSLTIGSVYLGGAYWAAHHFDWAEYISPGLIVWFLLYQTLAVLMYGSLFIAIGAACSDMKETQNLLGPVMILICMPLFVTMHVIQEPNGPVATGLSFFPLATPMLMIVRQAVPPGIDTWQSLVGVLLVLATTVLCVWVAGRIFRVGILMQGKGARLSEMARWVLRG